MGIYLNPDSSKFEEAVNSDIYIDKTLLDFHKFFQLRNLIGNVVMNILYEFIFHVKSTFSFVIEKFIFRQII